MSDKHEVCVCGHVREIHDAESPPGTYYTPCNAHIWCGGDSEPCGCMRFERYAEDDADAGWPPPSKPPHGPTKSSPGSQLPKKSAEHPQWEYRFQTTDVTLTGYATGDQYLLSTLNECGKDGWECVHIQMPPPDTFYKKIHIYLKRQKRP